MTVTGQEDLRDVTTSAANEARRREAAAAFETFVMAQEAKRRRPRRRLPPGVLSVGAILLMILAAGMLALRVQEPAPEARQAGTGAQAPAGALAPTVQVVAAGLELAWEAVEGADQYVVVVLGEDLAEVHRSDPVAATRAQLAAADLPAPYLGGFVQVVALLMDVELETSPLVALPPRR